MHVAEIPRSKAAKGQKVPKNQLKNSVIRGYQGGVDLLGCHKIQMLVSLQYRYHHKFDNLAN